MGSSEHNKNPGQYILAARDIIDRLKQFPQLYLTISFYEIYGSKLHDLLNERQEVKCLEDGQGKIQVKGIMEKRVKSVVSIMKSIDEGLAVRSSG